MEGHATVPQSNKTQTVIQTLSLRRNAKNWPAKPSKRPHTKAQSAQRKPGTLLGPYGKGAAKSRSPAGVCKLGQSKDVNGSEPAEPVTDCSLGRVHEP